MQNKPNFGKAHNELNSIPEKDLRKLFTPPNGEKQTQSKPNQSQFKPNQTRFLARYEKTNPIQTQNEPNFQATRNRYLLLAQLILRALEILSKPPFFRDFLPFHCLFSRIFADFFNFFQTFAPFAKYQNPPHLPLSTRSSTKSSIVNRKSKIPSPPLALLL